MHVVPSAVVCISRGSLACTTVALLMLAPPASAQCFGQNKVQYGTFEFQVLRTENFDVYFGTSDGSRVAFVTDRFTTRLVDVSIGAFRLATIGPGALEKQTDSRGERSH
jgi:hypothetical protein